MSDIQLTPQQQAAVNRIVQWFRHETKHQQVARLFGYAGSGKSTITRHIIEALGRPERDPREDLPKPIFKKGILKLEDLNGKRISGFGKGSLGWTYVSEILGAVGIGKRAYREEPLGPTQAIQALKDGKVDLVWGTGNPPNPSVVELGATHKFRLVAIPTTVLDKLDAKAPSWQSALIPKGVYKNMEPDADVATLQQTQVATTSAAVDADTVYAAVWAVMEHLEDFWSVHPGAKFLTLKTSLDGMPVPLHAGAVRYYRAKGVTIPARLVPPEAK